MMDIARTILASVICTILALWYMPPVGADISLYASTIDSNITHGQHFSYDIGIKSKGTDKPMNIAINVYGVNQTQPGDYSISDAEMDHYLYTARPFLRATPSNFTLEPGIKRTFRVEGDVPDDIGEGGRYALIDVLSELPEEKGMISIGSAFRVPIKLTIEGSNLSRTGKITDIVIDDSSSKMQNVSVAFTNTGNYHYRALARADLVDKEGYILANATSEMSFANILPLTSVLFELSLQPGAELEPGTYYIKVDVDRDDGAAVAEKEVKAEVKS